MLAQRLLRGQGLESLTVLALLASLTSVCRLPSLASLQWTPGGEPCFPDGPEFSLTHSRGFAACAVAPRGLRVGIDIEPADRARAASVALVAGDAERKALDEGALSPTELWTAKEAVLKAAGAGLSDICGVAVRNHGARYAGVHYGWRHFRPRNGLLLAVATRGRMPAVRIRWPSPASVFG
jgi:phosphopantetheinyl transferase